MQFPTPLFPGVLLRRYQRFKADVRLDNGSIITAHCPDPGRMTGVAEPERPVLLSLSERQNRKLPYTLELIRLDHTWVSINTQRPNQLVAEALSRERLPELRGFPAFRREVAYAGGSRIDFLLEDGLHTCYLEVKGVSWVEDGIALFPDAVTDRGQKHLRSLMAMRRSGHAAILLFIVAREDARCLHPADRVDPEYGRLLREAADAGVTVLAYGTRISPPVMDIGTALPVHLAPH